MLARCSSAALSGLEALAVTVEVDLSPGLPGWQMVGLADAAVQESRERIRAALRNSGLRTPLTRVVVNLAPADRRKEGPGFDLPGAVEPMALAAHRCGIEAQQGGQIPGFGRAQGVAGLSGHRRRPGSGAAPVLPPAARSQRGCS
jgi:hypothetical protein